MNVLLFLPSLFSVYQTEDYNKSEAPLPRKIERQKHYLKGNDFLTDGQESL